MTDTTCKNCEQLENRLQAELERRQSLEHAVARVLELSRPAPYWAGAVAVEAHTQELKRAVQEMRDILAGSRR